MSESLSFTLELEQLQDYEFRVRFDWPDVAELRLDEPEPLGRSSGPNAARLIGAISAFTGSLNNLWGMNTDTVLAAI